MNVKRLPDFIIIGAAKAGTTTLYQYLCRHPQIYMSTPKEPDFFAIESHYARGMDWYTSLFSDAEPHQICGEASTTYSRLQKYPKSLERIVATLPNIKLIYIMRQPIDGAYSFYIHRLKGARYHPELAVSDTFEETIKQQNEFLDNGYYIDCIEKYLGFFARESCLFLLMEDLIKKPGETLNNIFSFIGVDPGIDVVGDNLVAANKAGDHPDWFVRKQLTASVNGIPGVAQVAKLLPKGMRDGAYQLLKGFQYKNWVETQYMPPPMLPETRQMLVERFREPNRRLAEFLNRDLFHWDK